MNTEAIIQQHSKMVYGIAVRYMRNRLDAEDVFSEVFLKYVKSEKDFESDEHLRYWLVRVTINTCKTMLTKRSREVPQEEEFFRYEAAPQESVSTEERLDLYEALRSIRDDYRELIELHYMNGLSLNDIAEVMDVPYRTVQTRMRRGKEALKKELEKKRNADG